MNRTPPNLVYLSIYNPTLRALESAEDDEDSEEQAHILFYTSKERAVSRDRMLRQIGLAKALVSFAELFNADEPCSSVHSQAKRMIMLSPEPNFWIHAVSLRLFLQGVRFDPISLVFRLWRSPKDREPWIHKTKASKTKAKPNDKGKVKENAVVYDYEEGSVHNSALRAHIKQGYEMFKLTHGSFASILDTLGQQALELQLERFWTVWAWSWDMDEAPRFGEEFGPSLHPHFSSLIPLMDGLSAGLSHQTIPFIVTRSHIIPSSKYSAGRYSSSLPAHLATMIPPRPHPSRSDALTMTASVETIRARSPSNSPNVPHIPSSSPDGGTFLGMPSNVVDMRKWNWPGYLTFGKGNLTSKPSAEKVMASEKEQSAKSSEPQEGPEQPMKNVEVEVDPNDLQDAISSDTMSLLSSTNRISSPRPQKAELATPKPDQLAVPTGRTPDDVLEDGIGLSVQASSTLLVAEKQPSPSPPPPALPEFSLTRLHLAPWTDPTATRRVSIHYLILGEYMVALFRPEPTGDEGDEAESSDLQYAAENVQSLYERIKSTAEEMDGKILSEHPLSANRILQTQDRYLISTSQYSLTSPGYESKSAHLFSSRNVMHRAQGLINEVFSRGQNPQHWHIVKQGLGGENSSLGITGNDEEVFMEVFRKDLVLADVDNLLLGVLRKSGLINSQATAAVAANASDSKVAPEQSDNT